MDEEQRRLRRKLEACFPENPNCAKRHKRKPNLLFLMSFVCVSLIATGAMFGWLITAQAEHIFKSHMTSMESILASDQSWHQAQICKRANYWQNQEIDATVK